MHCSPETSKNKDEGCDKQGMESRKNKTNKTRKLTVLIDNSVKVMHFFLAIYKGIEFNLKTGQP